ncbi:uncharacterized protein LOC111026832 [Myzus persicae]|uniref:uncharacterized protein LOC111026832 n=1 Tax=Myzus persicae TaxID=13164 RepID=UPI000B939093|nr:uncharacterized protein LOC111026832 [Myzus persicae]
MPRRCSVDQCHIMKNKIKCTLFKAPKDVNILTAWNEAVSKANGKSSIAHYVCQNHFSAADLISVYNNYPRDLNTNEIGQRKICSLKKGAIPSIFESLFECHSQNEIFNNIEQLLPNDKEHKQTCKRELLWKDNSPKQLSSIVDVVNSVFSYYITY